MMLCHRCHRIVKPKKQSNQNFLAKTGSKVFCSRKHKDAYYQFMRNNNRNFEPVTNAISFFHLIMATTGRV